ncbi:hypothetical protein Tco_0323413 [Tanacetum coccineum]
MFTNPYECEYVLEISYKQIPSSNLRIALERIQPEVIFQVCLEVLKKLSFFNAFILSADVPVIYMQQFWYSITQDSSTQKFYFQLDNQVIEVNAYLIHNALKITPRIIDHPFTSPPPEKVIINFIDQLGCNHKFNVLSNLRISELHQPWRTFLTMICRCLTGRASGYDRPRLPMLQILWGMVTSKNVDLAELIWQEFRHQIEMRWHPKNKNDHMPYLRFTKLIVNYIMSTNDKIPKRPLSSQHIIKLDLPLGNLKFTNKGLKDLIFGMPILEVMLTNDLKASTDYLEYLAKSTSHAHSEDVATAVTSSRATSRGKGLLTKNKALIAVQKVSIPKRKRTQKVAEEIGQNDVVANEVDSEATDEEEVEPTIGISIGSISPQESKAIKESPSEGSGIALEVSDEPHLKGSNEEAGVTPEIPDGPGDDSSSSSSKIAIEDLSSDDDEVLVNDIDMSMLAEDATDTTVLATESVAEVTKNDNIVTLTYENVKMTNVEMVTNQQVTKEQIHEQQNEAPNVDAYIGSAREAQADVQISNIQLDKPVNSLSHTFSSTDFTNQFLNEHEHADMNLFKLLINPGKFEVQSMVEVPFTQANPAALRHPPIESTMTLSHDTSTIISSLPPLTQPIQIKTRRFVKNYSLPNPQDNSSLLENKVYHLERKVDIMSKFNLQAAIDKSLEERLKQIEMMDKAKTFKRHPKHKALYDALAASLIVDEDDMDRVFGKSYPRNNHDKDHPPDADSKKKRRRDDTHNDPSTSADKEPKKKQKNLDSSNKDKDQADTLKKDKSSSKPSQST